MSFLTKYQPPKYFQGRTKVLKCLLRHRDVKATPEESVRQRVLNYLLRVKRWPADRITLEDSIYYVDGSRGRADIVLLDDSKRPLIIIECKATQILLGDDTKSQAIKYAQVRRARAIWLTNGDDSRFFEKVGRGKWRPVEVSRTLGVRVPTWKPPRAPKDRRGLKTFQLGRLPKGTVSAFALSALHLIHADRDFFKLPWSYRGVHVLQDHGVCELSVHTPGGDFHSLYRLFLVATTGRVETAGLGLNPWGDESATLCVVFLKAKRKHHALQLQIRDHVVRTNTHFDVYHRGRMGGRAIKSAVVYDALFENCRDDLITADGRIFLGRLPSNPDRVDWRSSRRLVANILHYALIRSSLRDALPYRKASTATHPRAR